LLGLKKKLIYNREQIFVLSEFTPATVDAISRQFEISKSQMFMACPGVNLPFSFGDFGGVRIIML
jgi:hypothetical protein